ncbi:MAG: trypsin-like peptidase domain-containing protein [Cyanobacteria bacterium]|nr:trypsin-like peptidase domain-containing protein [Cyanobacteriota bacterium]
MSEQPSYLSRIFQFFADKLPAFSFAVALMALFLASGQAFTGKSAPIDWRDAVNKTNQKEEYQLAMRNQHEGNNAWQSMFGNNPNLIADVAQQMAPSVVNIDVSRTRSAVMPNSPFDDEMLRQFFGFEPGDDGGASPFRRFGGALPKQVEIGNGSGVIIDPQGHILTNNHVVFQADKITVTLQDGRKIPARIVGVDKYSDLAVLKIDAPNLKPALIGNSDKLRPGEWVIAVGSPLGFDHTVTLGIISGISRRVPDINTNVDFIQTDAAINPGNSGGPLVNLKGEVIGINTAISGRAQNIGFAIPVNVVKKVTDAIIANGRVQRPWIGISMTDISPELAQSLGLPGNTEGVVVAQVMPKSPAAQSGFRQGDIIQRLDGQKIVSPKTVQDAVKDRPIGAKLSFQILRDGNLMALQARTEQLPDGYDGTKP